MNKYKKILRKSKVDSHTYSDRTITALMATLNGRTVLGKIVMGVRRLSTGSPEIYVVILITSLFSALVYSSVKLGGWKK